jgi:hypothetical protein
MTNVSIGFTRAIHGRSTRAALLACALALAACAHVAEPPVSHAHLGHALTAWMHTPGQRGLLLVAREQADVALRESSAAAANRDPAQARQQLARAAMALEPEAGAKPQPGTFGFVRALEESIEHVEYAGASNDASTGLASAAAEIAAGAAPLLDSLRRAAALAHGADQVPDGDLSALATRLSRGLRQLVEGDDYNGDGRIALRDGEGGLLQIEARLAQAVAAETNPPYRPLPQRLLFGVIRLPGGGWGFDPHAAHTAHTGRAAATPSGYGEPSAATPPAQGKTPNARVPAASAPSTAAASTPASTAAPLTAAPPTAAPPTAAASTAAASTAAPPTAAPPTAAPGKPAAPTPPGQRSRYDVDC